jgi:hypothetical protein
MAHNDRLTVIKAAAAPHRQPPAAESAFSSGLLLTAAPLAGAASRHRPVGGVHT